MLILLNITKESPAQLASTITLVKRASVKKLTKQFLCSHDYFTDVWSSLDRSASDKILDMVASKKGVIPYEKITDFDSFKSLPQCSEYFSKLKQKDVRN